MEAIEKIDFEKVGKRMKKLRKRVFDTLFAP